MVWFPDIDAFGSRSDREQLRARNDLHHELRAAFTDQLWARCYREDRGDGVLIVVPPDIPRPVVLAEVPGRLDRSLGARRRSDPLLRLRIAVHVGEVHRDAHGVAGTAVNHVFRLCDSAPLHRALDDARSDSALLVSEALYDGTVRGGHPGLDPASFHEVNVEVKETRARAWLQVPGDRACAAEVARASAPTHREESAAASGVSLHSNGALRVTRSLVAGGDIAVQTRRGGWWRRG